ncbi:hypothetical protein C0992_007295 [Termitomyces sp. T32_za158]|nr:hypothetical protein C0992_007295 [Termitomyces sp. T32_za158]
MKGRQPTDLMLRCTILDAEGNVKTISGQFKKADLSSEHGLNPRDLRKIDSRVPNLVPTILVRREAILINILHIRALVKSDAVILFDTYGSADSRLHSVFLYHLEINLTNDRLDDDMNAMYLTDKKKGVVRELQDHEELEVLLESFTKQVEEVVNEAENIQSNVQSTQEIVELILDSNRNALLALDLQVSIVTMGVGTGALIGGLFGMNLTSHFEDHAYAFYVMSGGSAVLALIVALMGLRKLSKIRKVGLSSSQTNRKAQKPWLPLPLRKRNPDGWS